VKSVKNVNSLTAGIIVFPGSNCDRDANFALTINGFDTKYIWHDFNQLLDFDLVFIPGGFSYGDYLRVGALARFSPVMSSVEKYILNKRGLVLGVCNGFQILTEAGILPGALTVNTSHRFICKDVEVEVVNYDTPFINDVQKKILTLPIAHKEGRYINDNKLDPKNIVLKYKENPNGSFDDVAGIINEEYNVFGLMPHPERACHSVLGNEDGNYIFQSIRRYLSSAESINN
jgi:phosphoribosylformylglycinamidine synthase